MKSAGKLPRIGHSFFAENLCIWSWLIAAILLPIGYEGLTDSELPMEDYRRFGILFSTGLLFLWIAFQQTANIIIYFHQAKVWGGRYYAFADVQLRVMWTLKKDIVFYLDDVLDALLIMDVADRQKVCATFKKRMQVYGDESHLYVSKAGLWQYLRSKQDRQAILFMQYLQQNPEFRALSDVPLPQATTPTRGIADKV